MKDDGNLRYVMVFGPCDQVGTISDVINRHRVSKGEEPISAGLTAPNNGSMYGAAMYLAAHTSNRLVVLCFKSTDKSGLQEQLQWFNRMNQKIILLTSRKRLKHQQAHNPSQEQRGLGVVAVFDEKEAFVNNKLALYIDRYIAMLQDEPSENKGSSHPPARKERSVTTPTTKTSPAAPATTHVSDHDFVASSHAQLGDIATLLKTYQEQRAALQRQLSDLHGIREHASRLITAIEAAFGSTAEVPTAAPSSAQSVASPPAPKAATVTPKQDREPKAAKGTRKVRVTAPPKEFSLAGNRSVTITGAAPQLLIEMLLARAPKEGATLSASEFTQAFGGATSTFYSSLALLRNQLTQQLGNEIAAKCFFNISGQGYRWDNSALSETAAS